MARLRPHSLRTEWTKILEFDWWVVINVDYIIAKEFQFLLNLVNLFTAQKRLELGGQLPRVPTQIHNYIQNIKDHGSTTRKKYSVPVSSS